MYVKHVLEREQPVERRYLTFATARPDNFAAIFRFRQQDMNRLMRCLRIPTFFTLVNGSVVNGHEGMLYIARCKAAMKAKKIKLSLTGTLALRTRNVAWVIDGYRCSVCRPSAETGGQHVHMDLQCMVYNSWKKCHNSLFQNVTTPYTTGLIADFAGPYLGRDNALNSLANSDILDRFRVALTGEGLNHADFDMIGDELYKNTIKYMYDADESFRLESPTIEDKEGR
ncbi:hypothetical protein B484DRAFT_403406 [Ochromonadaceae sp. CCMP2298]|nr:hypothetical protein B484DRAFT_403406 [Ochromonadaceae sp. CCMP2298]